MSGIRTTVVRLGRKAVSFPKSIVRENTHWLLFAIFASLFVATTDLRTTFYRGFEKLSWQQISGFEHGVVPNESLALVDAVGVGAEETLQRQLLSHPFHARTEGFALEYNSGPRERLCDLHLEVLNATGQLIQDISLPPSSPSLWQRATIELPSVNISTDTASVDSIQLRISQNASEQCWGALRSRLEWVSFSPLLTLQEFIRSSQIFLVVLCLCFSATLLLFAVRVHQKSVHPAALYVLFALLSLATQFRLSSYFYWDEWHSLLRFMELGVPAIWKPHNEHLLPLFFATYFSEVLAFAGAYMPMLVISCLLHALCSYVVYYLLQQFGAQRLSALFLTVVFTTSALHAESLQWAFEQSLVLCYLAVFTSICLSIRFVTSGRRLPAAAAVALGTAAPLLFGSGFIIAAYTPITLALYCALHSYTWRTRLIRSLVLSLTMLIPLALVAFAYTYAKEEIVEASNQAKLLDNLYEVVCYIFVGSQLGTILRGLSLLPSLELGVAPYILIEIHRITQIQYLTTVRPELVLSWVSFVLSLCIALFALLFSRKSLLYWFAAQLFLLSSFALPALGRWSFGLPQALSLRYQYASLFGLLLLLLPLTQHAFRGQRLHTLSARVGLLILWLLISVQLWTATQFTYYQENGARHRLFAAELLDWRETIGNSVAYEGGGTAFEGLQPSYPQTITPGKHPNDIYHVLQFIGATNTSK